MRLLRLALEEHKEKDLRIAELMKMAAKDKFLGDIVYDQPSSRLRLIYHEGEIVGMCWPRRESDGRYRTGPIFVDPHYRGKGIGTTFLKEFFSTKKGRAYIEPDNHASITMYKKAGFKKVGASKRGSKIARDFDQYLN